MAIRLGDFGSCLEIVKSWGEEAWLCGREHANDVFILIGCFASDLVRFVRSAVLAFEVRILLSKYSTFLHICYLVVINSN